MIRILITDDHVVVRRGIMQILAEAPDIRVAAQAGTGGEALQALRIGDFEVVVLDISLPDMSGMEVLKQMLALKPDLRVLILSMHSEQEYALRALRTGASGYLTKDSLPNELISAIRQVARGDRYITHSLAQNMAAELRREATQSPHKLLSERESQVLRLLAAGKTVSDIAAQISLSVKTVSTYRARILEKLELETTAEIVRYAIRHDLVE
jgi:two-component system invasion response regulator UvrY